MKVVSIEIKPTEESPHPEMIITVAIPMTTEAMDPDVKLKLLADEFVAAVKEFPHNNIRYSQMETLAKLAR